MSQFNTTKSQIGDMNIEAGVIVDLTAATTAVFNISPLTSEAVTPDEGSEPIRSVRFAGGSSRNMLIEEVINASIPSGWHKQVAKYGWQAEDGGFTVGVGDDGSLEWSDGTDVIMTAPAGSIPIADWISCSTAASAGGSGNQEITVDLGSATGLVTLTFNAYTVPDKFFVDWDGSEVINTGYRGTSGTYDGVAVTVAGPGAGTASFTKTTASPSLATIRIEAPFTGTQWDVNLGCPAAGAPPYVTPGTGRATFNATSTAYGDTLNGGTPFTLDVTYEGGATITQIELVSEPLTAYLFGPLIQYTPTRWTDFFFNVTIDSAGDAVISDMTDVIAERPTVGGEEQYLDPSGSYAATTYGKDTYNNGVDFSASVSMIITPPLELYTYLKVTESGGSVTAVTGPFSAPTLPANSAGVSYVPISYSDGLGKVVQYQDGALLWRGGTGGGTDLTYTAATRVLASSTGTDATLPLFTSTEAGLVPLSGGGTTNYLRADGTWAAAGGGSGLTQPEILSRISIGI